jgi:hypothetical protein
MKFGESLREGREFCKKKIIIGDFFIFNKGTGRQD